MPDPEEGRLGGVPPPPPPPQRDGEPVEGGAREIGVVGEGVPCVRERLVAGCRLAEEGVVGNA